MTTNSWTSGRLAAGSLAAAAVAVLAAANPAADTGDPASDSVLSQPASLPQTADAVDGWYTQLETEHEATTTSNMSRTQPAVRGWFIQRRTGQRFVINAGAPSSEATETPTADPAANWRRMMVEVP